MRKGGRKKKEERKKDFGWRFGSLLVRKIRESTHIKIQSVPPNSHKYLRTQNLAHIKTSVQNY